MHNCINHARNNKATDYVSVLTSDLSAEVKLHDVAVLQHGVVAHVGGVVRRHVVDRAARGERNAGLQVREQEEEGRMRRTIIKGKSTAEHNKMITHRENTYLQAVLLDELAVHLLDLLAHIDQLDSRLDDALREVAHLSVHLRRVSHVLVQGGLSALLLSA